MSLIDNETYVIQKVTTGSLGYEEKSYVWDKLRLLRHSTGSSAFLGPIIHFYDKIQDVEPLSLS